MMVNTFMKTEIFPSIGEEKFRTIANSALFTMVIIRLEEGAILYLNKQFCDMKGLPREQKNG